ncbi:MAG: hypothetical protein HQL39_18155 [Alphaproteobacteria bacterium]|nr:hypothetical protein [Alphaproteobacteria bacterium]
MSTLDPRTIEGIARASIEATTTNMGVEISMPLVYPNGQGVAVTVERNGDRYAVHDAGSGMMYLATCGVAMTKRLAVETRRLAASYGCELQNGRVYTACAPDQIETALVLVANASRAIGDEARQAVRVRDVAFQERLARQLQEIAGKRVRDREEITASSGRSYRIGHIILDRGLSHPIAFVEAVANDNAIPRRVAEFFDLREEYPDVDREAVYDDGRDWEAHNLVLLGKVANPLPYSAAAGRLKRIVAAL